MTSDPVLVVFAGYLVGSIPFAFLLARGLGGVDVRVSGSGNVGAANVLRTTRPSIAMAVIALDIAKGSAAVWMAQLAGAGESARAATGLAAVAGHIYPLWLRFHGGKGVAVACGAFGVLAPVATIGAAAVFAVTVWATRYVSVGSLIATAALTPAAYLLEAPGETVLAATAVAALILFRHRSNVARLRAGTERRFGQHA
ncbi:MAG: glycerol-3-phosphate 1-O-acyltransferase PlsY [Acidobacteria bacterium]|nr:glycerol-3-phosphate 1-O-acyltransferase PlsY [Acidobacteriota bacterium]